MNAHRLTLLAVLLALALPTTGAGVDRARLERLDAVMQGYIDDGRLAGSVVLVKHRGREVFHRAYGHRDREADAPMATDTIFRIASMSKAIVSTAVLQLQESGRLLIGDRVGKHLPEYRETTVAEPKQNEDGEPDGYSVVPAKRPITIRDLLTHTAGISYGNGPARDEWEAAGIQGWYFAHREEPIRETVRRIATLPFDAHPGERFVYGYNTDILGALVEVASGEPLDAYLASHIFEPLGMADTHFYLPRDKRDRLAVVYGANEEGAVYRSPDTSDMVGQGQYIDGPRASFSGGAGLLSTAADYGRFLQAMVNGGKLGKARILGRKSVELMTVDHIPSLSLGNGVGFGLGFSVSKDLGARGVPGSVGEFAWGGAYHTTYWADPAEDLVVVYVTQLRPARGIDDSAKLRALIYQALD